MIDDDPFLPDKDDPNYEILPNGCSGYRGPAALRKARSYEQADTSGKTPLQRLWEGLHAGDPERGEGRGRVKRKKAVDHNSRCRDWITAQNYRPERVDKWIQTKDGWRPQDFMGIWDWRGVHPNGRVMYVQLTSTENMRARLRKMCSDKKANDNGRPLIENLRQCLKEGNVCIILGYELGEGGKYVPTFWRIREELIQDVLCKRKKRPSETG